MIALIRSFSMQSSVFSVVLTLSASFYTAASLSVATTDSFAKIIIGLKFEIEGVAKYWAGTNGYWIPFLMNNTDIDITFDHIAAAGMKIVRT